MAKLLRKDIDRHDTSHETIAANLPADVAVAELSALLGRNDHRERLVQKAKRLLWATPSKRLLGRPRGLGIGFRAYVGSKQLTQDPRPQAKRHLVGPVRV